MMALARKIVSGDEEEEKAETVEQVFSQARDAETAAEELLVDDGWKLVESLPHAGHEVEPEAVAVNSLPRTGYGGNGHNDLFDIGPTAELVPARGLHANGNGANGNGHHEEADEPQQTLFSWAEFMAEEPLKPKGRSRKVQPASMSMFEWALGMEQERERQLVGTGN